ncbi:MAG: hypothetical protein LUE99_15145 [Bacteroides sp.]|nr:hypothetical protein [Bacteroides sp.]
MKQIGIFIISSLCIFSCSNEETEVVGNGEDATSTLNVTYTIPDTEVATRGDGSTRADVNASTGADTRADASYVVATAEENKIDNLYLLFFNPDEHGNGAYVGRATANVSSINLKSNTVNVDLTSGNIKPENEYSVLVIANLKTLLDGTGSGTTNTDKYLNSFTTKTYAQTWEELQVSPLPSNYDLTGRLPMSGTAVKPANSSALNVDLLRATVRIDVKVPDFVTERHPERCPTAQRIQRRPPIPHAGESHPSPCSFRHTDECRRRRNNGRQSHNRRSLRRRNLARHPRRPHAAE